MSSPQKTGQLEDLSCCAEEVQDANAVLRQDIAALRKQLEQVISGQQLLVSGQGRLENTMAKIVDNGEVTLFHGLRTSAPVSQKAHSHRDCSIPKEEPIEASGQRLGFQTQAASEPSVLAGLSMTAAPVAILSSPHPDVGPEPPQMKAGLTKTLSRLDSITAKIQEQMQVVHAQRRRILKRILKVDEKVEAKALARKQTQRVEEASSTLQKVKRMPGKLLEIYLDSIMCGVILANALFIGLQIDHAPDTVLGPYQVLDISFSVVFLIELLVKLSMQGVRRHFSGKDWKMNIFDACLILFDVIQVSTKMLFPQVGEAMKKQVAKEGGLPSASLFRVIRLVRLIRLMRLFRTKFFKDLLAMLQGLFSGGFTLMWAMILFVIMVYVVSLLCREFFGDGHLEHVGYNFDSVPRSMFTTFRCSFGDCNTIDGLPIPELVSEYYGAGYALGYCIFFFVMTIGLFNVISAIFVDSTMTAAMDISTKKRQERLNDEERLSGSVATIIKELLVADPHHNVNPHRLLAEFEELVKVEFSPETINEVIRSQTDAALRVKDCLDSLDIDPNDHNRLSDILDPDHSGTIGVLELVEGLRRLRGEPRRSDVVTVDLMVRTLQGRVEEVIASLEDVKDLINEKIPKPIKVNDVKALDIRSAKHLRRVGL